MHGAPPYPEAAISMNKDQIVNKQFSKAFLGYDVAEVDAFLDEIVRDNDRARQELDVARLRIKMLAEELEHARGAKADKKRSGEAAAAPEAKTQERQSEAPAPENTAEETARQAGEECQQAEARDNTAT